MRRGKKSTDPQLQTPKKQISPKHKEKKEGGALLFLGKSVSCLVTKFWRTNPGYK